MDNPQYNLYLNLATSVDAVIPGETSGTAGQLRCVFRFTQYDSAVIFVNDSVIQNLGFAAINTAPGEYKLYVNWNAMQAINWTLVDFRVVSAVNTDPVPPGINYLLPGPDYLASYNFTGDEDEPINVFLTFDRHVLAP